MILCSNGTNRYTTKALGVLLTQRITRATIRLGQRLPEELCHFPRVLFFGRFLAGIKELAAVPVIIMQLQYKLKKCPAQADMKPQKKMGRKTAGDSIESFRIRTFCIYLE